VSIRLPKAVWLNLVQVLLAGSLVLVLILPLEHALGRIFEADGQLEAATVFYQSWNEKHPEDYDSRWHTAELLLATVNPDEARLAMESMARDWPEDTKVLRRLVEIEDSLLRIRQVIPRLEALDRVTPEDEDVLLRLVDHYRWFGDTEKLVETLGRLVRVTDREEIRAEFLEILLANRRYDQIIEFYKTNMEAMPNQLEARFALYEAYVRTERLDEAIVQLEIALSIDPSRVDVLSELRDQLVTLNRWQDAIDLYKQRLAFDPGNPKLRAELSEMYQITADSLVEQGKSESARKQFYERIELAPKDLELRLEYASMFGSRREDAVGITEIKKLLRLSTNSAGAWLAMAERESWSDHPAEAAAAYARVHDLRPKDAAIHRTLANHLLWAEKYDEALTEFRLIFKKGGTMADRATIVELLLDKDKGKEAYNLVKPLLSSPTVKNRQLFAYVAARSGHCDEAIPELQVITERQPRNLEAWESIYECATTEKNPSVALKALRVIQRLKQKTPVRKRPVIEL
jgi:tetratricopeptide (TPR) repeat protein